MGLAFERLPAAVRRFHSLQGRHELTGEVQIDAPATPAGRALARLLGLPHRASRGPLHFVLEAGPEEERWARHFPGGCTMTSTLRRSEGRLVEQLGPSRLVYELGADGDRLAMYLVSQRFAGVPSPRALMPDVLAEEREDASGRFNFLVRVRVPLAIGEVAHYRGWLALPASAVTPRS
jgi:hypothetical protein